MYTLLPQLAGRASLCWVRHVDAKPSPCIRVYHTQRERCYHAVHQLHNLPLACQHTLCATVRCPTPPFHAHRQRTINWCDSTGGTAAAFDFTTKGILQEAVARREYWRLSDSQGRPPGVIGMWPSRGITFIDNHDTGSTLNHWPFPSRHLTEGYTYILTHPGASCLMYRG